MAASIMVYISYYLICVLGLIEVLKTEQLNTNMNLTAVLYGICLCSHKIIQCVILEKTFIFLESHQGLWLLTDNAATIGAMFCLSKKLGGEIKEVRGIRKKVNTK